LTHNESFGEESFYTVAKFTITISTQKHKLNLTQASSCYEKMQNSRINLNHKTRNKSLACRWQTRATQRLSAY